MRLELIAKLEEGLQKEDVLAVGRELSGLIRDYKSVLSDEKYRGKSLEDELTEEEQKEIVERDALDTKIHALLEELNAKRKEAQGKLAEELKNNLSKKKAILKEFQVLVAEEENIGESFAKRKEIQEKWSAIGRVPADKFDEVQQEYSRLNDEFNYNINLYKAIKEHDLKRNYSLKNQVIFQLNELYNEPSVKKVQEQLNVLMAQWDEIGPTFKEEWEKIKDLYWDGIKQIREKVNVFYEEKRKSLEENLELKKELIQEATQVAGKEFKTIKEWNESSNVLIELQEKWKKIGKVPKDNNEEIWKEFRSIYDRYFEKKKIFFDALKQETNAFLKKKKEIIEKANALKNSDAWKETSMQLVKLQKQWKEIGSVGKLEQKLWKEFRSACDHFFNAKKNYFDSREDVEKQNLEQKEALIQQINDFKPTEDTSKAINDLKEFSTKFNAIGNVAFKLKDEVYKKYKEAIDKQYEKLKIGKSERDKMTYTSKLKGLATKPNASKLVNQEKESLKKKLNDLTNEILQYENNLGFFGIASGAEAMIAEVNKKIQRAKNEIESVKAKIKLINQEANNIEKA